MSGKNNSNEPSGCLVMMILCIFAMPLVGIYLIGKGGEEDKTLGLILLVAGIVIWLVIGGASAH